MYVIFFVVVRPRLQSKMGIFLMLWVLIIALTKGIYMADSLLLLNDMLLIVVFLASLILLSNSYTVKRRNIKMLQYVGELFLYIPKFLKKSYQSFSEKYLGWADLSGRKSLKSNALKILVWIVIAIPILLIVYPLLSSADPIFKDIITKNLPELFNRLTRLPKRMSIGNVVWFLIITILIISSFYQLSTRQIDKKKSEDKWMEKRLNSTTASTTLIFMNLIYLIFCYVQIKYLFASSALPAWFTYAQYAVQGFWQLVIINLINIWVLLATTSFSTPTKFTKVLLTLIFACNAIMFVSGYERLHLYLSTYGFSYERILSLSFMFLLWIWIIISFVKVFYTRFKVSQYYIITFLLYYLVINIINIDKIVVDHNVERYHLTNKIDMQYLSYFVTSYENLPKIMETKDDPNFYIIQRTVESYEYSRIKYYEWEPTCSPLRYKTNFSCNKYQKFMTELIALPKKIINTKNKTVPILKSGSFK